MHVVHTCNLACESCSHFSNQGLKGIVSLEDADRWMKLWNQRISPTDFSLLGGEPTIHPELPEFVELARRNWPQAKLRLVTNGFFLHRHPRLAEIFSQDRNTELCMSIHHDSAEYRSKIGPILGVLRTWKQDHGIRVTYYKSFKNWTRRYRGNGATMEPFNDGDVRRSWENCPSRLCRQLFDGKIWKCAPLAYLQVQNAKHHLSSQWEPYLNHRPLEPDSSDEEMCAYLSREEESCCGMCPANPERFELPVPMPVRKEAGLVASGS